MSEPLLIDPARPVGPSDCTVPCGIERRLFLADHVLSYHWITLAHTAVAFLDRHLTGAAQ